MKRSDLLIRILAVLAVAGVAPVSAGGRGDDGGDGGETAPMALEDLAVPFAVPARAGGAAPGRDGAHLRRLDAVRGTFSARAILLSMRFTFLF